MGAPKRDMELVRRAQEMRAEGKSNLEIAAILGKNKNTISRWLNPELDQRCRERTNTYLRDRYKTDGAYRSRKIVRDKTFCQSKRGRFVVNLRNGQAIAKQRGYAPCNATVDDVIAANTGFCHICGASQLRKKRKLAIDHCHKTGKFRGLLCDACNHGLGHFRDSIHLLSMAMHYLHKNGCGGLDGECA